MTSPYNPFDRRFKIMLALAIIADILLLITLGRVLDTVYGGTL